MKNHKIVLSITSISDIAKVRRWLIENIEPVGTTAWTFVECAERTDYWFEREQDATFFALKWAYLQGA